MGIVESVIAGGGTGVYPWVGSIYPGGWMALGGGYKRILREGGLFNALGGWSLKNYKIASADLKLPELIHRRVSLITGATWLDAPEVAFYGVGNDSPKDRSHYTYTPTRAGVNGALRVVNGLMVGGGVDYLDVNSSMGDVTYAASRAFVAYDWRESPGYSRSGGFYRLEWSPHVDRGSGGFAFRQTEAEVIQLIPIFHESSVLAFHGVFTTTDVNAGNEVPVFMLPSLGGGSTLRGYPSWRFRDRNRLLLSGEYRWTPAQVLDMALFVDAGEVGARPGDFAWRELKTDYGIGARIHGPSFTAFRLDVARSREGWAFNIGAGAAF
jgi:hypothetical protein